MADDNNENLNNNPEDKNKPGESGNNPPAAPQIPKEVLEAAVAEALKPMKDNVDKAYQQRDELQNKIKEFEERERARELKDLEDQGKYREAAEKRLEEERKAREQAESRVVELTRDLEVRTVLGALPFRNETALDMAYKEIIPQLVKNADGVWVHRSGTTIGEFVKSYGEDSNKSFLFKAKASSGGGSGGGNAGDTNNDSGKSLFARPQEEVLRMAREGKLPNQN
jgi:hypothetical protein